MDELNLRDIIELEMLFWTEFNVNPFELFGNVSVNDMRSYFDIFKVKKEERDKQMGSGKLLKMLSIMRDMLNSMQLPEK